MKSWHIIVLHGCKIITDREVFNVKDANTIYDELKKQGSSKFTKSRVKMFLEKYETYSKTSDGETFLTKLENLRKTQK